MEGGPPAGGVEGVAGDEHSDEKEENEEDACSPGEDGPSPGVDAGNPALPNPVVEPEDWKGVKEDDAEEWPTLVLAP